LSYLSRILDLDNTMRRLRVDSKEHASYLNKDERKRDLDNFAQTVSLTNLTTEDRNGYLEQINQSKQLLTNQYGGIKINSLPILIGILGLGFLFGWKVNDMYSAYAKEEREKFAKEIVEMMK